jgi:predicted AlkP superfamily phosphohydrolase/phosphomutase
VRKLVLAAALACAASCVDFSSAPREQKLVILGFDGLDPDLARAYMRDGRLPNLSKLAAEGGFHQLQSTNAADCEAAWASFAAGRSQPKPETSREPAHLLFNFVPLQRERWTATRAASFWSIAAGHGVHASVLNVPGTFPPEDLPHGELLAGLPLPDIRNTQGTYHLFATNVTPGIEGPTLHGGLVRRLVFQQRVAQTSLAGPLHPVTRDELSAPMTITWNHEARSANIQLGSHAVHLREREWSRWLPVDFEVSTLLQMHGLAQLFLIRAGTELQLYVSPVHWDPSQPPAPISSPRGFARELYERLGAYRTHGWNAPTAALTDEWLDEGAFMDDVDRAFQDRSETILNRLDARRWDVLIGVIETADRVQHMMWRLVDREHPRYDADLARRFGASIAQSYEQADEFVGDVRARLEPGTLLMVVSDHGFHAVRSETKWSGDHTPVDGDEVAGLLVTNARIDASTPPRLIDIAPTALKALGIAPPPGFEGRPLF